MQVSLYGHSLGSVLSYDILCHQDNLLSPFHVDLASKENLYRTSSNANVGKQHFESGSTSNLGKDILVKNESKGMEDATDEGMLNVNSELSSVEDLANSAPAIPPVSSADELSPVPVGSKQTNNDSTSADEHSPLPVVSKQPDDDSPSADELSPVPEGSRLPNDDSKSDEIQTNSVSGRLEGSSDDEHSLPHVESIEPHDDSPSNEVHANFVPAIHLVSASDENPPVHVGGSEPNDYSLSDNNITPPILDHCSILADVRDESNKSENRNSDLAEEKDGISENLVGCSMGNTAEVSENIEVKSIDALMKEVMIFTFYVTIYLRLV